MRKKFSFLMFFLALFLTTTGYAKTNATPLLRSAQDDNVPVEFSTDDEEHWYYIQFVRVTTPTYAAAHGKKVWSLAPGDTTSRIMQLDLIERTQSQQWKFVGDQENGFSIVNRSTGKNVIYNSVLIESPWTPADAYITSTAAGATFKFVDYSGTDAAYKGYSQMTDVGLGSSSRVNDQSRNFVCNYSVNNDGGNPLKFIDADKKTISTTADSLFVEAPINGTGIASLPVVTLNLTSGVTAAISAAGADASAFAFVDGLNTLPVSGGGTLEISFSPTEKKVYRATLTLTSSGADPVTIRLIGNGFDPATELPRISDDANEYWYYLQFYRKSADNLVWALSDTTRMIVQDTLKASNAVARTDMQWKITGDWENGYQIINRATGDGAVYTATAITEDGKISVPAGRYYTDTFNGQPFGFVRFGTTDAWQFINLNIAATTTQKYVNDQGGRHLTNYNINDAGNRLVFIPAGRPVITVPVASLTLETPANVAVTGSLSVTGLATTGEISVSITGADAGVFSVSPASLPKEGGQLIVTFNPTATKTHNATLVLSSANADNLELPLIGNSDIGLPTFSTDDKEVWYYIEFTRNPGGLWTGKGIGEKLRMEALKTAADTISQHWKFVGTWTDGVKIVNRDGGEIFYDEEIGFGTLSEPGDRHKFHRKAGETNWQLRDIDNFEVDGDGDPVDYWNDYGGSNRTGEIGLYYEDDGGNPVNFILVYPGTGTGISRPNVDPNDKLVATKYYNLQGAKITRPLTTGIYIEQKVYASGKTQSTKKFFVVR